MVWHASASNRLYPLATEGRDYVGEAYGPLTKLTIQQPSTLFPLFSPWACLAACDASAAPAHGTKGDCTATLASGSSCQPICNAGFTASGTSSCSAGTLTAATCAPNGELS